MTGTTRAKLTRSLPRGYFADAQDHFASPRTDNAVQGTGVPGAAADTASAIASPAGDSLPVGMDTRPALGVSKGTACGGLSSPQDCHEIAQQLRAARLLRL